MIKRISILVIAVLVVNLLLAAPVQAVNKEELNTRKIEKTKKAIIKLGTGKDALIQVKLTDKTKIKGYISQVHENSFVVVDQNNVSTEIPYPQVKQAKGNNLTTGAKVAIGLGILAGVLAIWLIFENYG